MDLEFLANLGWREALVAIVALLALYILYIFLRINHLHRETRPEPQDVTPEAVRDAVRSYSAVQASEASERLAEIPVTETFESPMPEPSLPSRERLFPWNEPPDIPSDPLNLSKIEVLEQELAQLRRELGVLRSEIQTLRETPQREPDEAPTAQTTSPFYSEAMQLAVQGRDSSDISVLCGISRAEADLVVALVRNKERAPD